MQADQLPGKDTSQGKPHLEALAVLLFAIALPAIAASPVLGCGLDLGVKCGGVAGNNSFPRLCHQVPAATHCDAFLDNYSNLKAKRRTGAVWADGRRYSLIVDGVLTGCALAVVAVHTSREAVAILHRIDCVSNRRKGDICSHDRNGTPNAERSLEHLKGVPASGIATFCNGTS